MKSSLLNLRLVLLCVLLTGLVLISACRNVEEEKENMTFNYTIAEVLNESCNIDNDCETPMNYLLRSSCPYTSKCIDKKCTVVCPTFNGVEYPYVRECSECPLLAPVSPDFCKNGKLVSRGEDECGCARAPACEPAITD